MAGVCESYKSDKSRRIFWSVAGKQQFRKLLKSEFPTVKKAYQEAVRLEAECAISANGDMRIIDFYNNVYLINRNINEGSKPSYKAMFQRLLPFLKQSDIQYLSEVNEEVVIKYLNYCKTQIPKGRKVAYSPKTLNRDRDYLNLIFEMGKRKGFLKAWDRKEVQRLSEEKHRRMPDYKDYPNPDERKAICKWMLRNEPYYFAWVHFDATYGWRRDEVRLLRWPDIDFGNKLIKLLRTKEDQRMFALSDEDIIVLTEHILILKKMDRYDPLGHVFPNIARKRKAGTPGVICKNNLYKAIKRACKDMEITKHITPHKFRHAVSSELKHSGRYTDEEIIQITGHKDTDSLKHYAHPRTEAIIYMRQELSLGVMPRVRKNE